MDDATMRAKLEEALARAAVRLAQATSPYWHIHNIREKRKDQINERNLTAHFVQSLLETEPFRDTPANCYYEATFPGQNFIDCFIYFPLLHQALLIETKHLAPEAKKNTIDTDIRKLDKVSPGLAELLQRSDPGPKTITQIILVDTWNLPASPRWETGVPIGAFEKLSPAPIRNEWQMLAAFRQVVFAPAI